MVRILAAAPLVASVTAFTSFNSPSTPGNWNLPTDAGFGADLAHGLPEIQVRYQFPATDASTLASAAASEEAMEARLAALRHDKAYSFLQQRGQADLDAALSNVAIESVADDKGVDAMLLGLAHSPRPSKRASMLKFADPMELIPAGVVSGIAAKVADETPYTLVLHAPEEGTAATNQLIDSFAKIESGHEHSIESAAVAEKQRLLNAELAKVHDLVAASRRSSFLKSIYGSMVRKADYEIDMHAPSESSADINAAVNSILKVESSKAQSANAADAALKSALLSAEIAKIGRIVRGH